MAVFSIPKYLYRVKKSLEWFGQFVDCLCGLFDVVLFTWVNNMLIVILWEVLR